MTSLTRRDLALIGVCIAVAAASIFIVVRYWSSAFPEASIEFRYDRESSRRIAESVLDAQKISRAGMKHTVVFDADDDARVFLERSIGLEQANRVMRDEVRVWFWRHRWYRPLQEEEYSVEVAPTGEIVSYTRTIPEARPLPPADAATARRLAEAFLTRNGMRLDGLTFLSDSERRLPSRVQRILTWESKSIHPAGSSYRVVVTVDGNEVSSYAQQLRVPDEWLRSYRELRAKNHAAGNVDTIFYGLTLLAALVVFVIRLRRGDLHLRFLIVIGIITIVLVGGVTANSAPSTLASYDTTTSYPAFIFQLVVVTALQSIGTAMLLIVICGAGEVLYRQRLPHHLALPRLWNRRALASKRVFLSLVVGYTLVPFFIAYQTAFYLIAARFGAWSPADVPYDDILNTAIPWIAVLFAGFFPAMSEEFLSRAFSIPFFQRVFRSRIFAIVLAGFIWGFGHSTYPNQPFYIRGLEVGLAGVVLGFLMDRYGLLSLLIWHYTVDAVYTSLLLFRSGNTYYVASAAIASAVFAIPLVVSIVLFIRNRGFVPDDDLTNAALPAPQPAPVASVPPEVPLPPAQAVTRRRLAICVAAIVAAALLFVLRPSSTQDVVDYRITKEKAKEIAARHIQSRGHELPEKVAAVPVAGFRYWDADSAREDGGAPGGFDDIAATHLLRNGLSVDRLNEVFLSRIHAATWSVRFFTPETKQEFFVEIDPRTARVLGYHMYAEEEAPGAALERRQAFDVAVAAFAAYGVNPTDYDLTEALAYQQPKRRDWLFHFDEKKPIAAQTHKRVSVRVMGNEVTQFAATVKVPEAIYRQAQEQNVGDVILILARFAGTMGAISLLVTGFIIAFRHGAVPWKRVIRATLIVAPIPIMTAIARLEFDVFAYNTAMTWDTFMLNLATNMVREAGVQILLLFGAFTALTLTYPYAFSLLKREGRARFGRAAAVSALTAIAILAAGRQLIAMARRLFPQAITVQGLSVSDGVSLPLPSLFEIADGIVIAIFVSAAIALYATAVDAWPRRAAAIVTVLLLFCVSLDPGADTRALPLMFLSAAAGALIAFVAAKSVLRDNLLAWPAAAFAATLMQSSVAMAQNARADLLIHGAITAAAAIGALAWLGSVSKLEEAAAEPRVLEG